MKNTDTKTNKFLSAIQKYANEQKDQIISEVESFKQQELKKAEDEALSEAYKLILHDMSVMRMGITSELSKREYESQKKLFERRSEISDAVFEKAAGELIKFTESPDYGETLLEYAATISEFFGDKPCTVYIKEADEIYKDRIVSAFTGECRAITVTDIKIGGIRGYCPALKIVIDETLDTKLYEQRKWFVENSGLKVV